MLHLKNKWAWLSLLNNSETFSQEFIDPEEFLNRMIEVLGIT